MTTDTKQVSHYEVISDRGIKFIFDRPEDLPQIRDRFGIKSIRAVFTDGTTQ